MIPRVLGVHGVNNYDPRATDADRAAAWRGNLSRGFRDGPIPDFDLGVAYYAPALHLGAAQGDRIEALTDTQREDAWSWLEALGLPDAVAQGPGTGPLRQALEWLARRFDLDQSLIERFVRTFFAELDTYLNPLTADRRDAARDIVRKAIDDRQPRIILAHSLGSVVTYEALWREPYPELDLWVTMGSPLAMPSVVYDRLDPSPRNALARKPPGVARWVNVADPGDLISVLRPITRYFEGVDRIEEPSIHKVHFHLAKHYLASPEVAAIVRAALVE